MFVNSDNYIKYLKLWLITLFSLIVLMVAVGGLTRLTDSGLSITAWELFTGILPPLNITEWNFYFSEYKKIPEYLNINYGMSLDEFKVIFYWEYAHRLLARFVGLFTLLPLLFFSLYFKNTQNYSNKYYWIFFLVCLQGFIGWYMVSSGLIENNDVSHFRLSIHLSLALFILCLIFWYILDIYQIKKLYEKIILIYPSLIKQFKKKWCINELTNKYLPFDFCVPEYKIIIELDGPQHFRQIMNWKSPEEQHRTDKFKEECANNNGYSVIRLLQEDVLYDTYDWVKELYLSLIHI